MYSNLFSVIISFTSISLFAFVFLSFSPAIYTCWSRQGSFERSCIIWWFYLPISSEVSTTLTGSHLLNLFKRSVQASAGRRRKISYINSAISFICFLYYNTQEVWSSGWRGKASLTKRLLSYWLNWFIVYVHVCTCTTTVAAVWLWTLSRQIPQHPVCLGIISSHLFFSPILVQFHIWEFLNIKMWSYR